MDDRASPEGVSAIDRDTVARAMLRANSQCQIGGDGDWPRWETLTPPQQAKFLHIADAAIAAMSKPEMVAVPATMADGWRHDICATLNRVMPSWIAAGKTPIEAACNAIEALAAVACEAHDKPAAAVPALEVFRIAGGDTECCPDPTADKALECLRDLRQCYDEALAKQPAAAVPADGMLPDALVPHAKEWYRLCERRFSVDRITISGKLAEAIVTALAQQPAALAVSAEGVLSAVKRAISKGYCPDAIEEAYEQYEAEFRAMLAAASEAPRG